MHGAVRELEPLDAAACDAIVAGLREWFGNEQGIRDCALAIRSHAGLVATDETGVTGFLSWTHDRDRVVGQITWMAVQATSRRRGIGRSLLGGLIERLQEEQIHRLDVKTLSERPAYAPYAETRAFYLANGFGPVAELDIWDDDNPRRPAAPFVVTTAATPRPRGTSCTSCRCRTGRARCAGPCR
jgi:ribosomal protein S18 acetylase RimI-like enzyme